MSDGLFGKSGGGLAGGLSGGMQAAAVALLIQQLMKHARASGGEAPQPQQIPGGTTNAGSAGAGGGGIGDILGGLLGGAGGGALGGGLLSGLGGLLGGLRGRGIDDKVNSWVQPGPNQSVSADELSHAFDPKDVDEAARHAGTDRNGMMNEVSRVLPGMVDRMTPQGRVPGHEADLGSGGLGGLLSSLLGGHNPGR